LALLSADLGTVAVARPDLGRLVRELSAPHDALRREGADTIARHLAAGALWCVLCWLAVGLIVALLAQLPGRLGATGRRAGRVVLPAALRRIVAGAAGLGVFVAPAAALADTAPHGAPLALPAAARSSPARSAPAPLPSPLLPSSAPAAEGRLPAPILPTDTASTPAAHPDKAVVVQPGDSLWRIAARSLGRDATPAATAAAWPSWYAANRAVIGDDPGVLSPGQVLRPPSGSAVTS
jgi:nucleoid-associated protein YgaU